MLSLMRKELCDRLGAMFGWGLGLGGYAFLILYLYPAFADQMKGFTLPNYYMALGDWSDFASMNGWLSSEIFDLLVPIGLGIFAIVAGTAALAGEEENGTLETLLTLPLPRWQIVLGKALSLGICLLVIVLLLFAGTWAGLKGIESQMPVTIDIAKLFWACLNTWPVVMFFMMLSLWLGAYLPRRGQASIVAAVVLICSYLLNNLSAIVDALKPYQKLSPLHYYASGKALTLGIKSGDVALLLGLSALCLALAVLSFQRRAIMVGIWPWQRARIKD
jgi:ABC-2 type transport system permease protein